MSSGPKPPARCSSVPGPENIAAKPWTASSAGASTVEGLPGRRRDVPAVDDDLVEGDEAADLARHLDRTGLRHARSTPPGRTTRRRAPRRHAGMRVRQSAPSCGGVAGRRAVGLRQRLLGRRPRERRRQPTDVVEEVADRVLRARGRVAELVVTHAAHDRRQLPGGGPQVDEVGRHAGTDDGGPAHSSVGWPHADGGEDAADHASASGVLDRHVVGAGIRQQLGAGELGGELLRPAHRDVLVGLAVDEHDRRGARGPPGRLPRQRGGPLAVGERRRRAPSAPRRRGTPAAGGRGDRARGGGCGGWPRE